MSDTPAPQRGPEDDMSRLSDDYRDAVGKVIDARRHRDDVRIAHGTESGTASDAQEQLEIALAERDSLRDQYDEAIDGQRLG